MALFTLPIPISSIQLYSHFPPIFQTMMSSALGITGWKIWQISSSTQFLPIEVFF